MWSSLPGAPPRRSATAVCGSVEPRAVVHRRELGVADLDAARLPRRPRRRRRRTPAAGPRRCRGGRPGRPRGCQGLAAGGARPRSALPRWWWTQATATWITPCQNERSAGRRVVPDVLEALVRLEVALLVPQPPCRPRAPPRRCRRSTPRSGRCGRCRRAAAVPCGPADARSRARPRRCGRGSAGSLLVGLLG
jgi:hypothetical protein